MRFLTNTLKDFWGSLDRIVHWRDNWDKFEFCFVPFVSILRFLAYAISKDPSPRTAWFNISLPYFPGKPVDTWLWLLLLVLGVSIVAFIFGILGRGAVFKESPENAKAPTYLPWFWFAFRITNALLWLKVSAISG